MWTSFFGHVCVCVCVLGMANHCYQAPEVLSGSRYSEKADIYSFGMVLYELMSGTPPFDEAAYKTMSVTVLMYAIIHNQLRPNFMENCLYKDVVELLVLFNECVLNDAAKRPPMSEIAARLKRLL